MLAQIADKVFKTMATGFTSLAQQCLTVRVFDLIVFDFSCCSIGASFSFEAIIGRMIAVAKKAISTSTAAAGFEPVPTPKALNTT